MSLLQYVPPDPTESYAWYPINAEQLSAMHSKAQMLLYGGGSGGGKTDLLVADAAQERDNPNLRAMLVRRAFTEMPQIMDRTRAVYSEMGATFRGSPDNTWYFPSKAQVRLRYLKESGDIGHLQGNPFSYLGVDESTYMLEKQVRDILPWLAPTDPTLFPRVRLATNPGQIGADWHMKVFLRGHCPVHYPEKSVKPGVIYKGSKWSDGTPVNLTVSFIPSLAHHNPLYTQHKLDMLASQTQENKEKLLMGCWCALAGRYFSFLDPSFKKPYASVKVDWWWSHIISIDYLSCPAAGLYAISEPEPDFPEGRMFKVGEISMPRSLEGDLIGSRDFAKEVINAFVLPKVNNHPRRFVAWYCDPANDAHTGTGKSNFELMSEEFTKYDIPAIKSAKDRIGNAQNLWHMLKYGQVTILDSCPMTFNSLNTRMHDPKHPGDLKKIEGDPLDDVYDETSYAANTYFESAVKPRDVENMERLQRMRDAGANERTLTIEATKMLMQQQEEDGPIHMGRRRGPIIRRS